MAVSSSPSDPGRTADAPDDRTQSAGARGRAQTRARLREAGKALLAANGLHGVTSHDIAREAGVATGTFYLHFKDKQQLFREIIAEAVAALRVRLEAAVQDVADSTDRVRAHAAAMVDFAGENREVIRILFSGDADAAAVESDVLDDLAASVAENRRKRRDHGEPLDGLDPAVLSQAVVGMWARVLAWWTEDPSRASRAALTETLVRVQLTGTHPDGTEALDEGPGSD